MITCIVSSEMRDDERREENNNNNNNNKKNEKQNELHNSSIIHFIYNSYNLSSAKQTMSIEQLTKFYG